MQPGNTRYHALDSLRFFAAMAVLFSHSREIVGLDFLRPHWLLTGLMDSKAAVGFFFVLSGFVLHASLLRTGYSFPGYVFFMIRRVFRIYPLFYFSLLLCLLAVWFVRTGPAFTIPEDAATGAMNVLKADHGSLSQWLHHVLLVSPGFDMFFLNPPTWTLAVEVRIALAFPFVSFVFHRLGFASGALFLTILYPACHVLASMTIGSVQFVPLFALGAFMVQHQKRLILPSGRFWTPLLFLAAISLYGFTVYIRGTNLPFTYGYFISSIGSGLLMLLALQVSRLNRWLESKYLISLGGMSYGIYILHFGVLLALASAKHRWAGTDAAWLFPLSIFLPLALAYACRSLIEEPFIRLGRRIVKTLSTRVPS